MRRPSTPTTVAIVITGLGVSLAAWSAIVNAPCSLEPVQLTAGLDIWQSGRFGLYEVNPPLVKMVAALPVATACARIDVQEFNRPVPGDRNEFVVAREYLEHSGSDILRQIRLARLMCLSFVLVGAIACWRWADALYGPSSGIVGLFLWSFSPSILGHGSCIMNEVPAAALAVTALWAFWRWLSHPFFLETFVAGIVIGLAELSKFTLLIVYPLLPLFWLLYPWPERRWFPRREWIRQVARLALMLAVSVYVINVGYLFEGTFAPLEKHRFRSFMFAGYDSRCGVSGDWFNRFSGKLIGKLPTPLPASMVEGIDAQRVDFERGLPSYLRGEWSHHGWWYYYLYALLVKMPLGTWLLAGLAVGMTVWEACAGKGSEVKGQGSGMNSPSPSVPLPEGEGIKRPSPPAPLPLAGDGSETASPLAPLPTNLRSVPGEGTKGTVPFSSDENRAGPQLPSPRAPLPKGEGTKGTVPVSSDETWDSPRASWRDEMVVLAPFFGILIFVSSQTGFSVHSRYVIPALPFLFVWISKVGRALEKRPHPLPLSRTRERGIARWLSQRPASIAGWLRNRRQPVLAVLVIFALAWSVASSLSICPHSLSYFNELAAILPTPADASYPKPEGDSPIFVGRKLGQSPGKSGQSPIVRLLSAVKWAISAGPRNGPRHLLDSNIDWGQDLFFLKHWLDAHPSAKLAGLAYSGCCVPTMAGIAKTPQPPPDRSFSPFGVKSNPLTTNQFGPRPGWYALGVDRIYSRDRQYRYFLNFEPVAMAGYSIYIYHITLDGANQVRRRLGLPEIRAESGRARGNHG